MFKRTPISCSHLIYVACFYCCLLACQLANAVERITIAVGEWPPYISDKMKYQGRGLSKLKRSGQFDKYFDELLEGKYVEIGADD
ncbi:hypothetical protein H0A36_01695 [Endozoicomonas sp. SM1973]|uniref:Solute-binding protein family 3/N-terminal domain-containing protein n=1 Tax=Spartinivicinus marinus TaxID=2994442 RepID=A0A853I406_9GAMM|nr:hypothetical protein [Spartinivicinus marinus]MCX4030054.1 hypothetical protein [Spartinivicinus marinus]NYZ64701.1 hypothetical protein [Spartinivicinus marinus]